MSPLLVITSQAYWTQSGASGTSDATEDSYTISFSEPAPEDWDVNFFFGGALIAHNHSFQPYRSDPDDPLSAITLLGLGTLIDGEVVVDPASGFSAPLAVAGYGASGTTTGGDINGNQSPTHMGASANQFAHGQQSEGYLGFVLNSGTEPLYGWMRVSLSDDGSPGMIHEWAYSESAIRVGEIPEPGSILLTLFGIGVLLIRRGRTFKIAV